MIPTIAGHVARRHLPTVAAASAALVFAYGIVFPGASLVRAMLLAAIAAPAVAALTPQAVIAGFLLVTGVSTGLPSPLISGGGAEVYFTDVLVLVVLLRAALPLERRPPNRALWGPPLAWFSLWALVMTVAAVRGASAGVSAASVVRGDTALVYYPLLYFGLTRVLRERALVTALLWRDLAVVALGFICWMLTARALHHPFHDPGLGGVPTGEDETVLRNFGFASAFTIYPVVALVGVAGMAHGGSDRPRWTLLAAIGIAATVTTLVRGEIFGLALAIVVILWLRPRSRAPRASFEAAIHLAFATLTMALVLMTFNPGFGNAIIQRSLPFTRQAEGAKANADYRLRANETGIRTARAHPAGIGVSDLPRFEAHNIDSGYLAHSGVATLLIIGGWPALLLAILSILALLRRSFQVPAATPWLHPAFVGSLTVLAVYSISAGGVAGDAWVICLAALIVAVRFGLDVPRSRRLDRR
jgi:hypothetical protein